MLPLTYKCNLNCEYCYVDKKLSKSMNMKIALSAVDFLMTKGGRSRKSVDIVFIGGEPLIEWKNMLKIIFYSKQLAAKAKISIGTIGFPTNGLLLNEKILDYCRRENIQVAVSIDGFNNKRRTLTGENSFYLVEKKIPLLLKYADVVRIRSTIHPDYVNGSAKNFKKFLELGFTKIDMQPVTGIMWSPAQKRIYLKNLAASFGEIEKSQLKNKTAVDMKHLRDFISNCQEEKGCPKVKEEFLVDVDGNIYPCEFYLSIPVEKRILYAIGNINKGINDSLAESCMRHKLCDAGDNIPALKKKCSSCKQTQACYKVCFGYDTQKRKFDSSVAKNNWMLFRDIEKIFSKYRYLI